MSERPSAATDETTGTEAVLLVEDEPAVRDVMSQLIIQAIRDVITEGQAR